MSNLKMLEIFNKLETKFSDVVYDIKRTKFKPFNEIIKNGDILYCFDPAEFKNGNRPLICELKVSMVHKNMFIGTIIRNSKDVMRTYSYHYHNGVIYSSGYYTFFTKEEANQYIDDFLQQEINVLEDKINVLLKYF